MLAQHQVECSRGAIKRREWEACPSDVSTKHLSEVHTKEMHATLPFSCTLEGRHELAPQLQGTLWIRAGSTAEGKTVFVNNMCSRGCGGNDRAIPLCAAAFFCDNTFSELRARPRGTAALESSDLQTWRGAIWLHSSAAFVVVNERHTKQHVSAESSSMRHLVGSAQAHR